MMSQRPKSDRSPAGRVELVTPSDSVDFDTPCRGISFGTGGALSIVDLTGDTVVIPSGALAAGIVHPIFAQRINSTGTTAEDIVAYI